MPHTDINAPVFSLCCAFSYACQRPFAMPAGGGGRRPSRLLELELREADVTTFSNGISKPFIVKKGSI